MTRKSNAPVQTETPTAVLQSLTANLPRGWQAAFARTIGVAPQTVTKWLRGDVSIPREWWLVAERALGVNQLTFAQRTGLLAALPDLADLPADQLDITWAATFGSGRRRSLALDLNPDAALLHSEGEILAIINRRMTADALQDPERREMLSRAVGVPLEVLEGLAKRRAGESDRDALVAKIAELDAEIERLRSRLADEQRPTASAKPKPRPAAARRKP